MSVKAKCHNYTGCLLAYRGEEIDVASDGPMVCPDCGKPVTVVRSAGAGLGKIIIGIVVLAAIGAGVYFSIPFLSKYISPKGESPTPAPVAHSEAPKSTPGSKYPGTQNNPPVAPAAPAEPPKTAVAPKSIDLNVATAETARTREEVMRRIGQMPNVSQVNKDKLFLSVERAKSMGLLVTIPFTSGNTRVTPADLPILKEELEKPAVAKLRDDPTTVFVILGYADPKGDDKRNLTISQQRADSVVEAMRTQCGVANVIHAVAMGGSKLIDANNLEKNRVAEVWAVRP